MPSQANLGTLIVDLVLNSAEFKQRVQQAQKSVSGFERALQKKLAILDRVGKKLSTVGSDLTKSLTLPLLAAAAAAGVAVKKFADFDKRVAEIGTLLDNVTEESIRQIGTEIKQASITFGQSLDEMAKARYDIISAGFTDAADSITLLDQSAKLAVGGITTVAKSADVLTTVLNSYSLSADKAAKVSDIIFTTVRLGKTTTDELAGSLGGIAALAPNVGASLEEIGAAMATLTAGGLSTDEAATALRATFVQFLKPSKALQAELQRMGYATGTAAIQALGFQKVLQKTTSGIDEAELAARFPNVRAMVGVFPLVGKQAGRFSDNLEQMAKSAGASEIAFEKMDKTISQRIAKLTEKFKVTVIEIGESLIPIAEKFVLPALNKITEVIKNVTKAFSDLPPDVKNAIVGMAAFAAAIGPVLFVVGKLISIVGALRFAIGGLLGPWGLLAAGVAGLVGLLISVRSAVKDTETNLLNLKEAAVKAEDGLADIETRMPSLKKALGDFFTDWGKQVDEITIKMTNSFKTLSKIKDLSKVVEDIRKLQEALIKGGDIQSVRRLADQFPFLTKEQKYAIQSTDNLYDAVKVLGEIANDLEDKLKSLNPELGELPINFFDAANNADKLRKSIEEFNKTSKIKITIQADVTTAGGELDIDTSGYSLLDNSLKSLTDSYGKLSIRTQEFGNISAVMETQLQGMQEQMTGLSMSALQFSEIMGIFAVSTLDATTSFVSSIRDAVVRGGAGLKELGQTVLDSAKQFIRAKIAEGVAAYVASALTTVPFPFGIIAAGIAASAATALFNDLISGLLPMAQGGIVASPTMALIGEAGPEVVFPLKDLKRFIGDYGGPQRFILEGNLYGEDILLSQQRTQRSRNRFK